MSERNSSIDRAKVTSAMRKVLKKWPKAEYMTRIGNKKHAFLYQIWNGKKLLGTSADPYGIWISWRGRSSERRGC